MPTLKKFPFLNILYTFYFSIKKKKNPLKTITMEAFDEQGKQISQFGTFLGHDTDSRSCYSMDQTGLIVFCIKPKMPLSWCFSMGNLVD